MFKMNDELYSVDDVKANLPKIEDVVDLGYMDVKTVAPTQAYNPKTQVNAIHSYTKFDELTQNYVEVEEYYNAEGELIAKFEEVSKV